MSIHRALQGLKGRKSAILASLAAVLLSVSPAERALAKPNPLPNEYAILFASGAYKEGSYDPHAWDEGTRNTFLITLANVYDSLRQRGFDKEHISVFYHDGVCDSSEQRDRVKIQQLLREQRIGKGTKQSLLEEISRLSGNTYQKSKQAGKKAGSQNLPPTVIVYFTGHGVKRDPEGSPELEFEVSSEQETWDYSKRGYGPPPETLTVKELQGLLNSIPGRRIIVLDSCYSGYFCRRVAGQNTDAVASSSETGKAAWSRVDQFGRFFFGVSNEADRDHNGIITLEEALDHCEKVRHPYLERHVLDGDLSDGKGAKGILFGDTKTVLYRIKD